MASPLKLLKIFFYYGDIIGARGGKIDSVITRIRSGWSKFRDLVPLLTSRGFKGRLFSVCVCSLVLRLDVIRYDYTREE